jgi:Family of unknown function (DUF5681)
MNDDQDASRNTLPPQADVVANVEAAADADNRVGYRRPPRHSRFQPGQSGNPRGRPRGSSRSRTSSARVSDKR